MEDEPDLRPKWRLQHQIAVYELGQAIEALRRVYDMMEDIQRIYNVHGRGYEDFLFLLIREGVGAGEPDTEELLRRFCHHIWN